MPTPTNASAPATTTSSARANGCGGWGFRPRNATRPARSTPPTSPTSPTRSRMPPQRGLRPPPPNSKCTPRTAERAEETIRALRGLKVQAGYARSGHRLRMSEPSGFSAARAMRPPSPEQVRTRAVARREGDHRHRRTAISGFGFGPSDSGSRCSRPFFEHFAFAPQCRPSAAAPLRKNASDHGFTHFSPPAPNRQTRIAHRLRK